MKIKFINAETGEEMTGSYLIEDDGTIWEYQFGSADSVNNATHQWAGEAWKVNHKVKIIIECA